MRHAVPPTLVITAVAHVPDASRVVTPDLKAIGNRLLLVGSAQPVWGGSHVDLLFGESGDTVPAPDPDALGRYRRLHVLLGTGLVKSCHDVSEGGVAVAVAEMAIGGRLGVSIGGRPIALFGEANGRFLLEVAPDDVPAVVAAMEGEAIDIGEVLGDAVLEVAGARIPLAEAVATYFSGLGRLLVAGATRSRPRTRGWAMSRPVALVVRGPGTNRDPDVGLALDLAGAEARTVLAADLVVRPELLGDARMLVLAGGFSYADALGAGRGAGARVGAWARRRAAVRSWRRADR